MMVKHKICVECGCDPCKCENCDDCVNCGCDPCECDEVVELTNGQKIRIDGEEFVYRDGRLHREVVKKNEKQFNLYFDDINAKTNKVDGVKVTREGHYVVVDIQELLEKIFGDSVEYLGAAYRGIEAIDGNAVDSAKLSFSTSDKESLERKLNRMFEMTMVNKAQVEGFKSYVNEIFNDMWRNFYNKR